MVEAPLGTQAELLTRQFYEWERRGRGWALWDFPVALEPPFVPFRFHKVSRHARDDGQRHTLLSAATDRLIRFLRRDRSMPELDREDPGAIEPDGREPADDLVELQISTPADWDVTPEEMEHFFLTLPRATHPLAFEAIGIAESISIQFTTTSGNAGVLRSHLRAHMPRVSVVDQTGKLCMALADAGPSVVIDYGLANEFMFPLRTFRRFSIDPLTAVCTALSDLSEGECGILQVLLEPVRNPWAASIIKAVLDGSGSPFFLDEPEMVPSAREKVSQPLFACVVRVLGQGGDSDRSLEIAQRLGWSLNALANTPRNRLIPLSNEEYCSSVHAADVRSRGTHRGGMLLSAAELLALVHPPTSSVRASKLVREARATNPLPKVATGRDYVLGTNEHGGVSVEVSLNAEQRSRHVYVVGASGVGKSTLLLTLILQDLRAGQGLAVLDPHGEVVDEILRRCPEERVDDVVLLDPADAEFPIGFNILSAHSELERTLLSSDLVSVFRRLSTSWGDQMTSVLGNAILAFLESERGGTLVDLRRFLVEGDFRREFLKTVQDPEVVYYWQKEFPLLAGKPQAPLLTRLDTFLRPKTIRYMVAQKESRLDFRKLMDSGGVLLCRLSQGAIGEENVYLLGTLLTAKVNQIATSRQDVAAAARRPFYLYIDEFHNFVTPSMEQILSGARKYKLGLVLAHHELQQIRTRSPEVLSSVLTNPFTRMCFRVGEQDARALAEGFVHFGARDLQSLGIGEAIARVERSEFDFNLRTVRLDPLKPGEGMDTRDRIVERSRSVFGRPRAQVEAMLAGYGNPLPAHGTIGHQTPHRRRQTPLRSGAESGSSSTPSSNRGKVEIGRSQESDGVPLENNPLTRPIPGRGGAQHKYLQELVRRWGESNGWRADVEESVLSGLGSVDIALRKGEQSIGCEIGINTEPEHEFENIQKCLAAGFERVLAVASNKRILGNIRRLASEALPVELLASIEFCSPEEMIAVLERLGAELSTRSQTVRGYRVKVRLTDAKSPSGSHSVVSSVVAKALRRLRGRE